MINLAAPATSTTAPTADAPLNKTRSLYWVALNKGSVAISPSPLPLTVKCFPTPQLLFGLETLQEAKQLESIALTASVPTILKKFREAHPDAGDVTGRVFRNSEPPTGSVAWSAS
jgi:hypothetical protein